MSALTILEAAIDTAITDVTTADGITPAILGGQLKDVAVFASTQPGPAGADGGDGANGADGAPGVGVPVGGAVGYVLAKSSVTDFDTEWVPQTGGGGGPAISSDAENEAGTNNAKAVSPLGLKTASGYRSPKNFAAVGDGVVDDTANLNTAIADNKSLFLKAGETYLTTDLENKFGVPIVGDGKIIKAVAGGGTQQLNSYADINQHIFGREYLTFYQKKLLNRAHPTDPMSVLLSGDSTTQGLFVDAPYIIGALLNTMTVYNKYTNISYGTSGHSSNTVNDWITTWLTPDLATNPDLYIVRWGIVDGSDGRTVTQYIDDLRTGLTTIRAAKDVSQQSILLMTPNSTSNSLNGADEKWYEQINKGIRQAARDFQCCFIDTYALWQDSRNATAWMDTNIGGHPEIHIHPQDIMNVWIASVLFDVIYPTALLILTTPSPDDMLADVIFRGAKTDGTIIVTNSPGANNQGEIQFSTNVGYFIKGGPDFNALFLQAAAHANQLYLDGATGAVLIGSDTPDSGSAFSVKSTTKGMMPPKLTNAQEAAIAAPTEGIFYYNTDLKKLRVFTGAVFETVTSA